MEEFLDSARLMVLLNVKRDETSTSRIVASARFARKIPVLVLIGPYFKDTFERQ